MYQINNKQVGGNHYKNFDYQPWDFITDLKLPYLHGCVIKYISRWEKGDAPKQLQDLRKVQHYLEKVMSVKHKRDGLYIMACGENPMFLRYINQFPYEFEREVIYYTLTDKIPLAIERISLHKGTISTIKWFV